MKYKASRIKPVVRVNPTGRVAVQRTRRVTVQGILLFFETYSKVATIADCRRNRNRVRELRAIQNA